jgi:hypothetical protein
MRLISIFKLIVMLAFSAMTVSGCNASIDDIYETIIKKNKNEISTKGHFVNIYRENYFIGYISPKDDSLEGELDFLLFLNDSMTEVLSKACKSRSSNLSHAYNFDFSFSKIVEYTEFGDLYIAMINEKLVSEKVKSACI